MTMTSFQIENSLVISYITGKQIVRDGIKSVGIRKLAGIKRLADAQRFVVAEKSENVEKGIVIYYKHQYSYK